MSIASRHSGVGAHQPTLDLRRLRNRLFPAKKRLWRQAAAWHLVSGFNHEDLVIRLNHAMQSVGIWRLVLDTIQPLSASLPNPAVLRAELRRLSGWLKARGVTGGMAGERRDALGALTGQSPKKLVSDFNMAIDQRVGAAGCVGGRAGALSGGR